jgi:hypothetical protein
VVTGKTGPSTLAVYLASAATILYRWNLPHLATFSPFRHMDAQAQEQSKLKTYTNVFSQPELHIFH